MLFALRRAFQDIRDYRHKAARFHFTAHPFGRALRINSGKLLEVQAHIFTAPAICGPWNRASMGRSAGKLCALLPQQLQLPLPLCISWMRYPYTVRQTSQHIGRSKHHKERDTIRQQPGRSPEALLQLAGKPRALGWPIKTISQLIQEPPQRHADRQDDARNRPWIQISDDEPN